MKNYFARSVKNLRELRTRISDGSLGIKEISVCEVIHCGESFGIALNLANGDAVGDFKISYSGDTRPCSKFEEISAKSDVFIHECTFSDDLQ